MNNDLWEFLISDYARSFLSLAGFVLSVLNTLYLVCTNHFNIKIIPKYAFFYHTENNETILDINLIIENRSKVAVSISRMYFVINNIEYEISNRKQRISVKEFLNSDGTKEAVKSYTESLPQTIQGMGAIGGNFYIKLPPKIGETDVKNTDVKLLINTNIRKKCIKIDLQSLLDYSVR